jgi:hypothetical protein
MLITEYETLAAPRPPDPLPTHYREACAVLHTAYSPALAGLLRKRGDILPAQENQGAHGSRAPAFLAPPSTNKYLLNSQC